MTNQRTWIYIVAAWVVAVWLLVMLCWPLLGQNIQLSWSANPYVISNELQWSANDTNWVTLIYGDATFTNFEMPALQVNTNSYMTNTVLGDVWVPDCQPHNFYRVKSWLTPTPIMAGEYHWWEKDWDAATNFSVSISQAP